MISAANTRIQKQGKSAEADTLNRLITKYLDGLAETICNQISKFCVQITIDSNTEKKPNCDGCNKEASRKQMAGKKGEGRI